MTGEFSATIYHEYMYRDPHAWVPIIYAMSHATFYFFPMSAWHFL